MHEKYLQTGLYKQLAHIVEESGEVTAAIGKTLRFGPLSVNPEIPQEQQETNIAWVMRELRDLELAIARAKVTILEEFDSGALQTPNHRQ